MKSGRHGDASGTEGFVDGDGHGGDECEQDGNGEGCSLWGDWGGDGTGGYREKNRAPLNGNGP